MGIGNFASVGLQSGQVSNRHSPLLCVLQLLAHAVRASFAIAGVSFHCVLPEPAHRLFHVVLNNKGRGAFFADQVRLTHAKGDCAKGLDCCCSSMSVLTPGSRIQCQSACWGPIVSLSLAGQVQACFCIDRTRLCRRRARCAAALLAQRPAVLM